MSEAPATALAAWGLDGAACSRVGAGHINATFRVAAMFPASGSREPSTMTDSYPSSSASAMIAS